MTSEEFLQKHLTISHFYNDEYDKMMCFSEDVQKAMIDFAKYHVEQALLKASEVPLITKRILFDDLKEGEDAYFNITLVDKESILNAYPLDNIK